MEQVTISKNLTLQGAGAASTIIQAPVKLTNSYSTSSSGAAYYPIILAQNATVNIDGFTIDGLNNGNNDYRYIGIAYVDADGTISNNVITNITDTPAGGNQHGIGIDARSEFELVQRAEIHGVRQRDKQAVATAKERYRVVFRHEFSINLGFG